MTVRVDAIEAQRLIEDGIRTLDVLPSSIFVREHLPGAINLPLENFEPGQVDAFGRAEPLLVYCFDQHCDLSARACARLEDLGFEQVHDLIGGRAAWTALGLPTDGDVGDLRRIAQYVTAVPTVGVDASIADVVSLGEQRFPVPVINADGVLLGAVDAAGAAALLPTTRVTAVMMPAPRTIRPELRVDKAIEQLRRDEVDHVFVTAVNGALFGLVVTDELDV